MTKLYRSKSAAIRHAIECLGAEWETEAFLHESRLPGEEFVYSIHMKGPQASSRGSLPAQSEQASSPRLGRSTLKGATRAAWAIADSMRGQPRRVILAACAQAGIAAGTAATQYQAWRKHQRLTAKIKA